MPRKPRLSIDQGIKELLQLRPVDAFAFLLPDFHAKRGDPMCWEFLATQVRKKDLRGKGYLMDLNIRYEFPNGASILLILVEHWSEARRVDLVRTAHYYLDLMERFPEDEIVPVALITERKERAVLDQIAGQGGGEEFLRFRTRVVQLACQDARRWAATTNLVATTMLLAMNEAWDGIQTLLTAAADAFQASGSDEEVRLLFPLFVELGKLDAEEEETIMSYLATMPKPKIQVKIEDAARKEGLQEGLREGLQETARRMLAEGFAWEVVTRITGLSPEDLAG
jgi:hypothetical protein